jgi:hypothetical protein
MEKDVPVAAFVWLLLMAVAALFGVLLVVARYLKRKHTKFFIHAAKGDRFEVTASLFGFPVKVQSAARWGDYGWALMEVARQQALLSGKPEERVLAVDKVKDARTRLISRVLWGKSCTAAGHDQTVLFVTQRRVWFRWVDVDQYWGSYLADATEAFKRLSLSPAQKQQAPADQSKHLLDFVHHVHRRGIDLASFRIDNGKEEKWDALIRLFVETHNDLLGKGLTTEVLLATEQGPGRLTPEAKLGFSQIVWYLCRELPYDDLAAHLGSNPVVLESVDAVMKPYGKTIKAQASTDLALSNSL